MGSILDAIADWLKELLISGIMGNLTGVFDSVNSRVGEIAADVGMTPANFSPGIFSIACYELIQLIIEHNNLANFETWIIFKWIFKTFVAVTLISNCFNIVMAVFDVCQNVISRSGGIIGASTAVSDSAIAAMEATLETYGVGTLLGIYLMSFVIQLTLWILSIVIFVIVYGRMIEVYLMTSLAPIPLSTFGSREQSQTGQNYLRSLFALGFQGFLIIICVGIYAVLIQSISFTSDIVGSLWGVVGYTVLLVFTLFKTGGLARSVLNAH